MLALTALPASAIDINNLPDWVRDSIHPVEIDWSQVYPGLAPPPAWAQDPAAVQEVHPGAGTAQTAGIDTLSTVSPAGPAGALNVAHPTTAATGGLQTVSPSPLGGLQTASPASGPAGIGGLAPVHPSAAATAGLHEVKPTTSAMTGLHEVKPGSSVTAGLQPVSAGPIVGQINRLAPTDTRAQQLLLTWSAQLRDGTLDRDGLKQLITEQDVPSETLVGVLNGLPLAHPMDPVYLPVCKTLWQRAADDIETCLQLAYAPRIYMATYLGTIAREEDAKTLLSSLANPNKMALGADLYHVACELLGVQQKSPRLCIWAWKRGSQMRGPADQAFVCHHIRQACMRLPSTDVVRDELIPWGEAALELPGAGQRAYYYAISSLLWGYDRVGERTKGIERAEQWLTQASGDVDAGWLALLREQLCEAYVAQRDYARAADVLRDILASLPNDARQAIAAQSRLIALAAAHDVGGPVSILPPGFERLAPAEATLRGEKQGGWAGEVAVVGNPTFQIIKADCPGLNVAIDGPELTEVTAAWRIRVRCETRPATDQFVLTVNTNDPAMPTHEIPVIVTSVTTLAVRPASVFFGLVKIGETRTQRCTVTSIAPVTLGPRVVVDDDAPVDVTLTPQGATSYQLEVVLRPQAQATVIQGTIRIGVEGEPKGEASVPYYAQIVD